MSETLTRVLVVIRGEIDIITSPAMQATLEAGRGRDLEVDLSGVTFMDCSGIRVLMLAREQAAEAGGSLTLRAPSQAVCRLLDILHLDEVLPAIT
jgi:anti-anti-sigma factor